MRKVLRATVCSVAIAGAALVGVPAASADAVGDANNNGILNGNDVAVQVPVNACGNQVNVIAVPVLNSVTGVCKADASAQQGTILGGLGY